MADVRINSSVGVGRLLMGRPWVLIVVSLHNKRRLAEIKVNRWSWTYH